MANEIEFKIEITKDEYKEFEKNNKKLIAISDMFFSEKVKIHILVVFTWNFKRREYEKEKI